MKRISLTLALYLASLPLLSQQIMRIEDAMRYAVQNNSSVKVQELDNRNTQQYRVEAVSSLFPSLEAGVGLNNAYGRSIDPQTNTYTTQGNISNSYGVSTSLVIFDGLANINSVKAAKIRVRSGGHTLQQIKDEKALEVMRRYYDALYYRRSIELVGEQLEAAKRVLLFTRKQSELGLKSGADVVLSQSHVADYDFQLTQQRSNYQTAMLELKDAMNYPLDVDFELIDLPLPSFLDSEYGFDLDLNPQIQLAQSSLEESHTNLKIARGRYLPTISVGAGYNTNYFKQLDTHTAQRIFFDQLKDNYGYYFSATLSIPIFNNHSRRSNVIRSKNNYLAAKIKLDESKRILNVAISQAQLQRDNYYKEYQGAQLKIEANKMARDIVEQKYEQGLASIIDLHQSDNDLLMAKAQELRSALNYQIEHRMVEYYSGIPLVVQ